MSKGTLETTLPNDVSRLTVNAHNASNLSYVKSQLYFAPLPQGQDSMLYETVTIYTPIGKKQLTEADIIPPDRRPSVLLHHAFPGTWEVMQPDQKDNSVCHRTYWLGEAWDNDEIYPEKVSSYLVKSLAERVKRFKKNVGMNYLTPFDRDVYKYNSTVYEVGENYQEWFYSVKGQSKYDWDIVNQFAKGEKIESIEDQIFCFKTPVITKEEIELVYEELKKNPEPKILVRPSAIGNDTSHVVDKLVDAVGQLTALQVNNNTKKGKENGI